MLPVSTFMYLLAMAYVLNISLPEVGYVHIPPVGKLVEGVA